jgi:nucleoside-diphosphate-sugar epimerase
VEGRVLVTGATGFLGGALIRRLRAEGRPVLAMGRDPARCADLRTEGFTVLSHDLCQPLPDPGPLAAIVHCAARSSPHGRKAAFQRANVTATANILATAQAGQVPRFVFISSSSVAFAPKDQLLVRESDPLPRPFNAYAASKQAAEALVLATQGVNPVVLRPRGIYGAGDTALLPRLLHAAGRGPLPLLRQGQGRIDLTHVDDVVAAIMATLYGQPQAGGVFNVSGGEVLPITGIVGKACAMAGVTPRWRAMPLAPLMAAAGLAEGVCRWLPGGPEPVITRYGLALFAYAQSLDLARARDILGWTPQVSFDEGLRRTFHTGPQG